MKIVWVILLLLLFIPLASAVELSDYRFLTLKQTISNDIDVIALKNPIDMEYFEAHLHLFPQNTYRQEVISTYYLPSPKTENDKEIIFYYPDVTNNLISFKLESTISTQNTRIPITKKISFPLVDIPNDIDKYVGFTDSIDSNPKIQQTANSLANNVDDLFELEFLIASWVNENINYNLSTANANANIPSSHVIENGNGVCDEITNLFISLNRALGIPARFVSGIAYTNSKLFDVSWGNHGWAEVYFPDIGWVPYDVTYKQFGYIDATHISLQKGIDGATNSVRYSHRGDQTSYSIHPKNIEFATTVVSKSSIKSKILNVDLSAQKETVGFGSYDIINLEIKNTQNYYVVEFIQMAKTIGIKQFGSLNKLVMLKPYETKTIPFIIKTDSDLNSNSIYTFPFSAYVEGKQYSKKITVLKKGDVFSEDYMNQFIKQAKETTPLEISCNSKSEVMLYDNLTITCSPLTNATLPLRVCLDSNCKKIEKLSQNVSFDINADKLGIQTTTLIQAARGTSASAFVTYKTIDNARLYIKNVSIKPAVHFDDEVILSISIAKESLANAKNTIIRIKHPNFVQEWNFPIFDESKNFDFTFQGSNLHAGENNITIEVSYFDSFNVSKIKTQTITTTLTGLTTSQKITVAINSANAKATQALAKVLKLDSNSQTIQVATILSLVFMIIFCIIIIKVLFKISKHLAEKISRKKEAPTLPEKIAGTEKANAYKNPADQKIEITKKDLKKINKRY